MKFLTLAVFTLCTAGLRAEPPVARGGPLARQPVSALAQAPGDTPFKKLANLYAQGTLPTRQEMLGWFSGRCFFASATSSWSSIVAGVEEDIGDKTDRGPLFPPVVDVRFRILTWTAAYTQHSSMYYDNPDNMPKESTVSLNFLRHRDAREDSGSLVSQKYEVVSSTIVPPRTFQFRKSGPYFIGRQFRIADNSPLEERNISQYCYYFKKLSRPETYGGGAPSRALP